VGPERAVVSVPTRLSQARCHFPIPPNPPIAPVILFQHREPQQYLA
jgi:hypothetical protein